MMLITVDSSSSTVSVFRQCHFHSGIRFRRKRAIARRSCGATLTTNSDSFEVGRLIGSYGFMNITSYSGLHPRLGMEIMPEDVERLRSQDVGEGSVKIRLYEGRIAQGTLRGTPVIFKVYPGQQVGGLEADLMAANEFGAHAALQSNSKTMPCQNIQVLLGGFETKTGEQWLAFRYDGKYTAADYAKVASEKFSNLGGQRLWNPFDKGEAIKRRMYYVTKLLQGVICGLGYMHDCDRLHQSLGPSSVVLNTIVEKDAMYLVPRLRDLAFSVDISYTELEGGSKTLSEGLWRRASAAGAFTPMEKRAFGVADDIYEAGLLLAYLAFIPFCEAGVMDSLALRRLLENTFQLDVQAMREYCLADDRLLEAVKFLDLGNGAGWELLQAIAATFKVGGEQGWQESTDFRKWASSQKFTVGDALDFEYSSLHSVVEVPTEDGYKNCDISTQLRSWTGGKDKINLNTTGTRYFVCGTPGHCENGMKLKITTVAASQSSTSTSTSASSAKAPFFGFFAFLVASSSAVVYM